MNIPPYATIVVSYISYEPQTIALNGRNNLHIRMEEKSLALEQVVVTAMGIQKKMSSLTYSTQQISSNELTRAKEPNMINTLAGKTAGVQINKTANLGGSAKVVIRGARSAFASGNNQPLYVIDGVPMLNSSTESTSTVIGGNYDGLNRDAGDGISNLNPDDIESINILKGSSAAALYGSQAANGVILITTKKGKAGLQRVTFSSNLTVSHAISTPEFQNTYGRNEDGGTASWGTKGNVTDYDNIGEFFSNGITTFNSLAITTGNEKVQTYFSYANTTAKGIVDNNKLQKNNLNLHETASLFNNKLKLDGIATLMTQTVKNSPATGGYYLNPLVSLYSFPRGVDMSTYRENFETWNADRNMMTQNWIEKNGDGTVSEWGQNPYWLKTACSVATSVIALWHRPEPICTLRTTSTCRYGVMWIISVINSTIRCMPLQLPTSPANTRTRKTDVTSGRTARKSKSTVTQWSCSTRNLMTFPSIRHWEPAST